MANELRDALIRTAQQVGIDPVDLGTVISYETAGTFDPGKRVRRPNGASIAA